MKVVSLSITVFVLVVARASILVKNLQYYNYCTYEVIESDSVTLSLGKKNFCIIMTFVFVLYACFIPFTLVRRTCASRSAVELHMLLIELLEPAWYCFSIRLLA